MPLSLGLCTPDIIMKVLALLLLAGLAAARPQFLYPAVVTQQGQTAQPVIYNAATFPFTTATGVTQQGQTVQPVIYYTPATNPFTQQGQTAQPVVYNAATFPFTTATGVTQQGQTFQPVTYNAATFPFNAPSTPFTVTYGQFPFNFAFDTQTVIADTDVPSVVKDEVEQPLGRSKRDTAVPAPAVVVNYADPAKVPRISTTTYSSPYFNSHFVGTPVTYRAPFFNPFVAGSPVTTYTAPYTFQPTVFPTTYFAPGTNFVNPFNIPVVAKQAEVSAA